MRNADSARMVFALAFVTLGLLSLFSQDFALVWQPVPQGVPGRAWLAMLSGAVMVVGGAGLLARRSLLPAALTMMAYTLLWLLVVRIPMHEFTCCPEIVTLAAACWVLYAGTATPQDKPYFASLAGMNALRTARIAFALALPLIGLEHLVYVQGTTDMVPGWLPFRMGWACFTGIAHIAAGLAIALNVVPRLAATLEAWMMGGFTVLVWIPWVVDAPSQRFAWTGLMISAVYTAASWIVAASYGEVSLVSLDSSRNRKIELATSPTQSARSAPAASARA
ncbi:DoxX family protein [Dyella flagellata]|uniref:DoxX family protein n=1 Tax=Dyella flagellata TaxID=1867833 RepID=A0ABQ5X9X9_9GAMM|nr:hypothetical protein [Dyella flagellata]GLQ88480.1 hypothetical protein GCM10007898_20500 [Dyella flagellata]